MKISLIGTTTFIGPAVIGRLLENGHFVSCLIKTDTPQDKIDKLKNITGLKEKNDRLSFYTGNLHSTDSILAHLKDSDAVVCLIDLKNIEFISNVLTAISRSPVKRVIFIGSTTVLVPFESEVKKAKLASEDMIKNSRLDYTILRPSMIFGTPEDRNFSKMIAFIKKRGFFIVFGNGNNLIQPVYVNDVANAVASCLENPATFGKTYEISGKAPLKYKDMIQIVKTKLGRQFKVYYLPVGLSRFAVKLFGKLSPSSSLKPDMIDRSQIDKAYSYESAAADFGYKPMPFEKGIEKLIKELEKN
jgi:nucleoside-diphosphate-sugar epimerase